MTARAQQASVEPTPAAREKILTAAIRAFSEKGFDGATTREIAARAGVNLGLIQYYFGGKQKLWRVAVDRAFEELGAGLDSILSDPSVAGVRERVGLLIRRFVYFVADHPEFIRLMHDEGKRRGPRMRWLADRHVAPLYAKIATLMDAARAEGHLPAEVQPALLHYMLVGAVSLIFHQAEECKRVAGFDPTDAPIVEAHAKAVERVFLGSPA